MTPAMKFPPPIRANGQKLALVAIVLLSVILRVWRLRQGLPDFLDEAIPFKQALEMWGWDTGRVDLNPHFFNYPTFAIYLHFLVQQICYGIGVSLGHFANPNDFSLLIDIDPTWPVVAARLLGIGADAITVWMTWRLAEHLRRDSGWMAALLVALSPVFIVTARAIHVDSIMTAFAATALERLLCWRKDGGHRRLAMAVVFIGLATGAKYTAVVLVVPLAWALWERNGWRGLRLWPLLAAAALGVFIISSPWVLLDRHRFWTDFAAESLHMQDGHLGVLGATGAVHYLKRVLIDVGPVAVLLVLLTLVRLRRADPSRSAAVTLWLALLPLVLGLLTVRMEADRYLEPVLLLMAPLAAAAAFDLTARVRSRAFAILLPIALLAPALVGGLRTATSGHDNTQQQARRWCEANLAGGELMVQEAYGVRMLTPVKQEATRRTRYFRAASAAAQARFLALPMFNAVSLPMASSGRLEAGFKREGAPDLRLVVFPQASDINQIFYDPRLLDGVDYFLVSGAMRHRYTAEPARFFPQLALYDRLADTADVAAHFAPGHGVTGPEITIYQLGPSFWRELREREPPLDAYWWARPVPMVYRSEVEMQLFPPEERGGSGFVTSSGQPAGWVLSLRRTFDVYVVPFALEMGLHLANRDQIAQAKRFAATILTVAPEADLAAQLFSHCAMAQGEFAAARLQVETTLHHQQRMGFDTTVMREELARIRAAMATANKDTTNY